MDSVDILYIATFALTILGYFVLWASQKLPALWFGVSVAAFLGALVCLSLYAAGKG